MIDINSICPNCMNRVSDDEEYCSYCGYDMRSDANTSPHALKPYTILQGKYLIGTVIGEGGFGITYIGVDLNLEIRIAIKEFYPGGSVTRESDTSTYVTIYTSIDMKQYEKWKDSFVREARSLARFSDLPGIVHVRDFFQENNTAYIVMEYVEGKTLKTHLANCGGRMPVDETLAMMRPVIQSLAKVHESQIIHRDISPDNIMIQEGGTVKLIDFGAARDFGGNDEKSLSVLLKPGFAPEEQYRSKGNQGPWTDVYALCATIYRCITGEKPPESMERMREDTLKKPSSYGIQIDPGIEDALLEGLQIFAENRIRTMGELKTKLYGTNASEWTSSKKYTDAENNIENTSPADKQHKNRNKNTLIICGAIIIAAAILAAFVITINSKNDVNEQKNSEIVTLNDNKEISGSVESEPESEKLTSETVIDAESEENDESEVANNLEDSPENNDPGYGQEKMEEVMPAYGYVMVDASDGGVNMRAEAGVEYEIVVSMIPNGIPLPVYEIKVLSSGKKWARTSYGEKQGWIALSQTDYSEDKEYKTDSDDPFYGVYVAAYRDMDETQSIVDVLSSVGFDPSVVDSSKWENLNADTYYCVTAGKCSSESEANELLNKVREAGYFDAYIKYSGERRY